MTFDINSQQSSAINLHNFNWGKTHFPKRIAIKRRKKFGTHNQRVGGIVIPIPCSPRFFFLYIKERVARCENYTSTIFATIAPPLSILANVDFNNKCIPCNPSKAPGKVGVCV